METDAAHPSPLGLILRDYAERREAAFVDARRDAGLGDLDARVLLHIREHPGMRPTELSSRFGITSAGATTLVDRLVDRGLLERRADENDRRVVRLHLTDGAHHEPWSELSGFDADIESAVSEESPESQGEAADLLRRLVERVRAR